MGKNGFVVEIEEVEDIFVGVPHIYSRCFLCSFASRWRVHPGKAL